MEDYILSYAVDVFSNDRVIDHFCLLFDLVSKLPPDRHFLVLGTAQPAPEFIGAAVNIALADLSRVLSSGQRFERAPCCRWSGFGLGLIFGLGILLGLCNVRRRLLSRK